MPNNNTLTINIDDQAYFDVSFLYATFDNQDDAGVTVNYTDATTDDFVWDVIGTKGPSQENETSMPTGAAWYGDVELLKLQKTNGEESGTDRGFVGQTFSVDSAKTVDSITFSDTGGGYETLILALSGSPVPEPTSLALFVLGLATLLGRRRRR